MLVGARETFERLIPRRAGAARLIEQLLTPMHVVALPGRDEPLPGDLFERVKLVLARLREAGFSHCVAVDLTREQLGIPVVRVLLAGAAGPYGQTSRRPALRLLRMLT